MIAHLKKRKENINLWHSKKYKLLASALAEIINYLASHDINDIPVKPLN